jgi:2-oxoglutarate ferredoxin oxidoreductase subunit delta
MGAVAGSGLRGDQDSVTAITISSEWCKGCHICVEVCPRHVLAVDHTVFRHGFHPVVVAKPQDCTACLQCELLCPDLAIEVVESE